MIHHCGIIVRDGFNDVLTLDHLCIPAVALLSNKVTIEQVAKIEHMAKQLANGRLSLLFDADGPGDEGAKEAQWQLTECQLEVRLSWTGTTHGSTIQNRQPEHVARQKWENTIWSRLWRE